MNESIKARIDADMKAAASMPFQDLVGFLASYTAGRFADEIQWGDATRAGIRAYADESLRRAMAGE